MKKLLKRFLTITAIFSAVVFTACEIDEAERVPSPELGAVDTDNIFEIAYAGSTEQIDVYASQPYVATVAKGEDWVRIGTNKSDTNHKTLSLNGDGCFFATVDRNEGIRRMALITLEAENRIDTVFIKQKGRKTSTLEVSKRSMFVEYQGGQYSLLFKSSVKFEELDVNVYGKDIFDKVDWVSNINCTNNVM